MELLLQSTPVALWHDIIHDAEKSSSIALPEELESYLVFLLMRYLNKPEMLKQIIAYEFLQGVNLPASQRAVVLQDVGDKCLLFAGLFPFIADKRLVRISYFVNMGQSAYSTISKEHSDLYGVLGMKFVSLMEVLQSIRAHTREYPDLLPLQAHELWSDTGSQRAFSVLKQYTSALPLRSK